MGVNHLEELRNYLKENAEKRFSKSILRSELRQNYVTIEQNIEYLLNVEKSIKEVVETKTFYQWRKK